MYKGFPSHPHSTESRRRPGAFLEIRLSVYLYGKLFPADAC